MRERPWFIVLVVLATVLAFAGSESLSDVLVPLIPVIAFAGIWWLTRAPNDDRSSVNVSMPERLPILGALIVGMVAGMLIAPSFWIALVIATVPAGIVLTFVRMRRRAALG